MAVTLTETTRLDIGQSIVLCLGTLTYDSSYVTAGEPVDATGDVGYSKVFFEGGPVSANWDSANQKVITYWGNAGTASLMPEVTSTTDLSAITLDYVAFATH